MVEKNLPSYSQSQVNILATNTVLRNTYLLLSLTLLFSAAMAGISMLLNVAPLNPLLTLVGYFALLIVTVKSRNSGWGILATFAFTGFLGFTLGPILNAFTHTFSNGSALIMQALGGTGVIFVCLSGYALATQKNFSYLGNFLVVGMVVAFLAGIANLFFHIPALQIAVSSAFMVLSSGFILYRTSEIIHGGETNYIMATIDLYVALYNLFLSLLQLLAFFSGNRD